MKSIKYLPLFALAIAATMALLAFTFKSDAPESAVSDEYIENTADQQDYSDCVTKVNSVWGGQCLNYGFSESKYTVELVNSCSETLDLMCAVQRDNDRWRVFYRMDMRQGDTLSAFACRGNGKYLKWVRKAGDITTKFPTIQQVNDQY